MRVPAEELLMLITAPLRVLKQHGGRGVGGGDRRISTSFMIK
ncbi:MAG: hypothetical protein ACP5LQ_05890 [Candidatus Methanodesulfokora sp.]